MEFTGRLRDLYRDMDGRAVASFRLEEEPGDIDELRETDLKIQISKKKNRRSLDSNAYFHVLCDRLRQRMKISIARRKNTLICRYGQVEYIKGQQVVIKTNIPVEDMLENETLHCQPCGVDIQNGQEINYYRVYRGSHTYDTAEMSRLHWTFIQSGYSTVVTNRWRSDGTFDELNRKMGYRFQLVSGTYGDQATAGGKLPVKMQIKNVGYAPLYNERTAYIVLQSGSKTYSLPLQSDPRRWLPNGVVTTIDEQLTLPSNIPAGTYQLYLYLPDKYASIASNAKYAVRFANTGVWESGTGMNKLNASVTVSGGNTPEPPQPVGDAVLLPATLNKANVASYSSDMSWYNTDYFDFGPADAENLDRWAEWTVELRYPGKYQVSEEMKSVLNSGNILGHYWHLQLLGNNSPVAEYTTKAVWEEGGITYDDKWDLSSVAKGVYTLRVQNAQEWGQPKLKSLTLAYDGVLPAGIGQQEADMEKGARYDILGRPVDADYRGIVITRGGKFLAR